MAADGTASLESTHFGVHRWAGVAGLGRVKAAEWLYFAARLDGLREDPAGNRLGESRPILIDAGEVLSATGTIDVHPVKGLSTRLELRHDAADGEIDYAANVTGEGTPADPFVPNAKQQTTVLLGVVGWF